ncbi:MAG: alanine racemase [Sulfurovaceae bacterium]|nr:alanine racemase [Sulfurovaceae bacterium]
MAYITLNRSNFYHNLSQIALKTGSLDKIAIVLKDNAYGHGALLMARLASEFGISKAVVRNHIEALEIEQYFDDIIVLGGEIHPKPNLSFTINSLEALKAAPSETRIELKVDTGMHRNGIMASELDEAIDIIKKRELNLVGVMSHFASADELGSEYFYQYQNFKDAKKKILSQGFQGVRFHIHNSAGILRCGGEFEEDLVRLGIGAYGHSHMPLSFGDMNLKPVMSLYAKRVSTKTLQKGARIGYGGEYQVPQDMTVSTYDIGYGDGWRRGNPFDPYVTHDSGPILGKVSMDLVSLEGDKEEVCIMKDALIASKHYHTISYEITCALHSRIERIIVDS